MESTINIQKFYDEVFEDFKNRLFIAYRFKSTISSQQIDKFSKIVKQKLHKKKEMFNTGIKFSLQKKNPQISNLQHNYGHSKVKIQHDQQNFNQIKQDVVKQNLSHSQNSQQQSEDDLNAFKQKQKDPTVKVQQPQEKQQEQDDDSQQQYEQQDRKKQEILAQSAKKIVAHVIATYSTRNKKHIPKDEKTKIDLENVFVRTADKEVFYTKIQCDFQQAQYPNIKL